MTDSGMITALVRSKRCQASRCARIAAPEIASGRLAASSQKAWIVSSSRPGGTLSTSRTSHGEIAATIAPTTTPRPNIVITAVQNSSGSSPWRGDPMRSEVSLVSARPMPRSKTCA